jgi:hypothetical protein
MTVHADNNTNSIVSSSLNAGDANVSTGGVSASLQVTPVPVIHGAVSLTGTPTPTPSSNPHITTVVKTPFKPPTIKAADIVATPWCYKFFPTWFLVLMYFVTCLVTGISACGVFYNWTYLDTPRTCNRHGEVMVNKMIGKQRPLLIGCIVCLLLSVLMVITAFVSMMVESFCGHVIVFILYFVIIVASGIIIVTVNGQSWIAYRVRKIAERLELRRKIEQEYETLTKQSSLHNARPRTEVLW